MENFLNLQKIKILHVLFWVLAFSKKIEKENVKKLTLYYIISFYQILLVALHSLYSWTLTNVMPGKEPGMVNCV